MNKYYKKNRLLYLTFFTILTACFSAIACPFCDTKTGNEVRAGILQNHFLLVLSSILSIFLLFIIISTLISYLVANKISNRLLLLNHNRNQKNYSVKTISYFLLAGMLLGGGIAGFLDGIIFHQILQFHSMIANEIPLDSLINVEINMFWDGIFHAFTLLIILLSLGLFWISLKHPQNYKSTPILIGSIFLGAGIFNLIEGFIDHHFLQLHHVIQLGTADSKFYADLIFLLLASIASGLGIFYIRKGIQN